MNKNEIQEIKDLNHIEYQISDIKNSMVQFIDEKEEVINSGNTIMSEYIEVN